MMRYWTIDDACRCLIGNDDQRRNVVISLMLGAYYGDDSVQQAITHKKLHTKADIYNLLRRSYEDRQQPWGSIISQNMTNFMDKVKHAAQETVAAESICDKFAQTIKPNAQDLGYMNIIASITPQAFLLSCCPESHTEEIIVKSIFPNSSASMDQVQQKYVEFAYFYVSVLKALINGARAGDLVVSIKAGAQQKDSDFKIHALNVVDVLLDPSDKPKLIDLGDDVWCAMTLIIMVLYFQDNMLKNNKSQHNALEVIVTFRDQKHTIKVEQYQRYHWEAYAQLQREMLVLILEYGKDQCAYNTMVGAVIGALASNVSMMEVSEGNSNILRSVKNYVPYSRRDLSVAIFGGTRFWSFLCAPARENDAQSSHIDVAYFLDFLFEKSVRISGLSEIKIEKRIFDKIIVANVVPSVQKVMNFLQGKNNEKRLIAELWKSRVTGGPLSQNEEINKLTPEERFSRFCLELCMQYLYSNRAPTNYHAARIVCQDSLSREQDFEGELRVANKEVQEKALDEVDRACMDFLSANVILSGDPGNCNLDFLALRSALFSILIDRSFRGFDLWSPDEQKHASASAKNNTIKLEIDLSYDGILDYEQFYKVTGIYLFHDPMCFTRVFQDARLVKTFQRWNHSVLFLNEYVNITRMQYILNEKHIPQLNIENFKTVDEHISNKNFGVFYFFWNQITNDLTQQHQQVRIALQKKRNEIVTYTDKQWNADKNSDESRKLFFILGSLCMYKLFDCKNGIDVINPLTEKQLKTLNDALGEYRQTWIDDETVIVPRKDLEVFQDAEKRDIKPINNKGYKDQFLSNLNNKTLKWNEKRLSKPTKKIYIDLLLEITKNPELENIPQKSPYEVWRDIISGFWEFSEKNQIMYEKNIFLKKALCYFIVKQAYAVDFVNMWQNAFNKRPIQIKPILFLGGILIVVIAVLCGIIALFYYLVKFLFF